jgi:hypothetical protein
VCLLYFLAPEFKLKDVCLALRGASGFKQSLAGYLPLIEDHVLHHQLADAFDLADEIKSHLASENYPDLWWDNFSAVATITSDPADATVFYRPYNGRNVPWRSLGKAPINNVRLPLGNLQLKLEGPGFQTQEFATSNPSICLNNGGREVPKVDGIEKASVISLGRDEKSEMVYVAQCPLLLSLTGLPTIDDLKVDAFYIDKHPVSNADFLQFVESGGYDNEEYWQHLPWADRQNWQQVVKSFVDRTEQAGPADWELGRIPDGQQNLPVTGISWFEAAAYAQFLGKRLPTAYEWARAALPFDAFITSIPVAIMKYSNFMGNGKSEPGEFPGLSGSGAYDMFGNVREWVWNQVGEERCNLGGCDSDLAYFAVFVNSEDPFVRDHKHGFRCVDANLPDQVQLNAITRVERTYEGEEPVSDAVYEALIQPLLPVSASVNATLEEEYEKNGLNWRNHLIDTGYGERIPVTMIMPPDLSKPVPSLVLFPGMGAFLGARGEDDITMMLASLDFVVKQLGYAIVVPYWTGAFERFDHGPFPVGKALWLERVSHWVQEASQTVNFIENEAGLDQHRIGFLGASYGVITTTPVVALEKRFSTAILLSGNLMHHQMHSFADAINFYPRIQCPTLLINGRYDTIVSSSHDLLDLRYKLLGTPEADKKQVVYEAGHWPYPQHLFKKEFADWLLKYL